MAATKTGTKLSLLVLVLFSTLVHAQTRTKPDGDRVTITPRKITLIRTGEIAKNFPHRRKATVTYPVVSGLRDPAVLRRVRAIVDFKNIFETTLAEYRADAWLEEFSYDVNYNQNYILDLTFWQTGSAAYPDTQHKHFTIDLRRGAVVKATDVFARSEEHTSELQSPCNLVCRLLLEQKLMSRFKGLFDPDDV